jgi:hypothetical protein
MTRRRLPRAAALCLGGLAALALPACSQPIDYGYFAVKVSVDPSADAEFLAAIATCGVNVEGADVDFGSLSCAEGRFTRHELGTFEWSTDTASGNVKFTVTLKNSVGRVVGTGTSSEAAIAPGMTVPSSVLVIPLPPPPM